MSDSHNLRRFPRCIIRPCFKKHQAPIVAANKVRFPAHEKSDLQADVRFVRTFLGSLCSWAATICQSNHTRLDVLLLPQDERDM